MKMVGIILAGGKSSRMGTDKGLMLFSGKPLITFSIELSREICKNIYISTSNNEYLQFGYPLISDIVPNIGPIGGLHAAMTKIKADVFFICSCDIPYASLSIAKLLLQSIEENEIVIPVWGDNKIEPLFGFYSKSVLPIVENQIESGNFKMIDLLNRCNTLFFNIDSEIDGSLVFKNFNSPVDVSK